MLAQAALKQQVWIVAPDSALPSAALIEEWQNSGCCPESLQPRDPQPVLARPAGAQALDRDDWWPGRCAA